MQEQPGQLTEYISQCLNQGMHPDDIRVQLVQGGWPQDHVDAAFRQLQPQTPLTYTGAPSQHAASVQPNRVRNAVLWIVSPYIILVTVAALTFLANAANIDSPIVNIIGMLGGVVGVILLPVGFIVGIIKLVRK